MIVTRMRPLIPLLGAAAIVLALGACGSSTEEVDVGPTPTTAAVQQPAPAATAMSGEPAAPAATAMPGATATPFPTVPPAGEPKYGGILRMSNRGDPPGWDSMYVGTVTLHHVFGPIAGDGNLIKPCRDNDFITCPGLASSWDVNSDFTIWTFTIRDNAFWHDGKPFTAQDAKWWMDLERNGVGDRPSSNRAPQFGPVATTEVVGSNQLRVTLTDSTPSLLDSMMHPSIKIAHPQHLMEPEINSGNELVSPDDVDWVLTGPYKMDQYRRGSIIRYRKFDQYFEKDTQGRQLPFLDGVDFAIIGDGNTMVAAFRAGRLDATARGNGVDLTPQQRDNIAKDLGLDKIYFTGWESSAQGFAPNSTRAPWDDVRVRQAAALWIDQDAHAATVMGGDGAIAPLFHSTSPWLNPDFRTWPGWNPDTLEQDRVEAKRLLAQAGFPNGFETTIMCRQEWVNDCEFIDQQLRGLLGDGNVILDVVDTATRDERICNGDFEAMIHGGIGGMFPEDYNSSFITTNQCSDIKHGDTHVDDLFSELQQADNLEDRTRIAREIERYVALEKTYVIQSYKPLKTTVWRSYVKGFFPPSSIQQGNADLAEVFLDK